MLILKICNTLCYRFEMCFLSMKLNEVFLVVEPFEDAASFQLRRFFGDNAIVTAPGVNPEIIDDSVKLWVCMNVENKVSEVFCRGDFDTLEVFLK